ncbi:MAG: phage major capsid protein [Chitinophagaceae bacterium]
MSLAARIKAAEEEELRLKDKLTEATEALEAAPDEDDLVEIVNETTIQLEKQSNMLTALKKAEKALAANAKPANEEVEGGTSAAIAPNLRMLRDSKTPGELMWKHATAAIIAHVEKKAVEQVINERYADDQRVKATFDFIQKSAVAPAMTTVPAWAGALVRDDTRGFIESIEDVSVLAALNGRVQSFSFDGFNSIKIPYENPLAENPTEPAWVGEAGVIPLTAFSFGSLTLTPSKLAAISTMSREIAARSTPAIEGLVQNLLRKAYARVADNALLNPTFPAVPNLNPASLLNGVAALPASAASPDENIRADILALLAAFTAARIGNSPVLIMNPQNVLAASMLVNAFGEFIFRDELSRGTLFGIPVISSAHVPLNRVIMVDAAFIAFAIGGVEFDVSDVATVTEANADGTAPTQAGDAPGGGALGTAGKVPVGAGIPVAGGAGASTTGYTARSLWQTYSLGIRMVGQASWGKLNTAAAQWIDGITWA